MSSRSIDIKQGLSDDGLSESMDALSALVGGEEGLVVVVVEVGLEGWVGDEVGAGCGVAVAGYSRCLSCCQPSIGWHEWLPQSQRGAQHRG